MNVAQLGLPPRLFCLVTFHLGLALGLRGCAVLSCHVPASPCGGVSCQRADGLQGGSAVWSAGLVSGTWTLPRRGQTHVLCTGRIPCSWTTGKSLYTFKWLVLAYKILLQLFKKGKGPLSSDLQRFLRSRRGRNQTEVLKVGNLWILFFLKDIQQRKKIFKALEIPLCLSK